MLGSVDIKVRPLRFACLVDPGKTQQVREAIQLCSSVWGGAYFPIVPLHKRMPKSWKDPLQPPPAKSVVLGYLEAFDPDVLVQFAANVPAYVQGAGRRIVKPAEVWQTLDEGVALSPRLGIGIFELLSGVFQDHFKYKAKYPPKIVVPTIPDKLSLFWASLFGEWPAKIADIIRRDYAEPLEIEHLDFKIDNLAATMAGKTLFPRRLTQYALNLLGHRGPRGDASVYFMNAAKSEDIIDFWNLRAMGRPVIPLPKQLLDDPQLKQILVDFLKEHRRHWRHDPKVCNHAALIRSRHATMDELQEYAKTLKIERPADDPSTDGFFSLQHWYPRIWDEWARDKDAAVPRDAYADVKSSVDVNGPEELRVRFKPLLPPFAEERGIHSEGRCANEIEFRFYGSNEYLAEVFPTSSGKHFDRAISGLASFRHDWRVGRHGLVKIVKYHHTETRDIPSAESILFAWLTDLGWKPTLSPPGLLAKQIYRILEGQPFMLSHEKMLGLLEHMNGGHVQANLDPAKNNKVTQERDMPVAEAKNRINGFAGHGNLYDYVVGRKIFRLGLRIQCPHCTRRSWFSLEMVRDTLSCPRCLEQFLALDHLDTSMWSYKTSGPFSVPNYADGAYAVILTLQCFDDRKMNTMRMTPAFSFSAEHEKKQKLEADFALFWQESIYGERKEGIAFGECKSYNRFEERDFKRMRHLAKTFPGAVLVFSTLRKTLTAFEIKKIAAIAKRGRKYWKSERPINPVVVLTGTELVSFDGAPYCWPDPAKERFRNAHGLLNLCDATQQLYLKLPSWHTDWHEKWEKRRKRLQAAAASATP